MLAGIHLVPLYTAHAIKVKKRPFDVSTYGNDQLKGEKGTCWEARKRNVTYWIGAHVIPKPYNLQRCNLHAVTTMEKPSKYLYVVRMDVDPEKETEFNDWYNKEHVPALLKVPGVRGASRYVSIEGTPKYVAIYELDAPTVRNSDAWKKAVELTPRPPGVTPLNAARNLYERIYP